MITVGRIDVMVLNEHRSDYPAKIYVEHEVFQTTNKKLLTGFAVRDVVQITYDMIEDKKTSKKLLNQITSVEMKNQHPFNAVMQIEPDEISKAGVHHMLIRINRDLDYVLKYI